MGEGRGESWADAIRARRSKDYWRSLADLLDEAPRTGEFPPDADRPPDGVSRREFLGLLGASMALAGAAGCSPTPAEKILPYTDQPPEVVPGHPLEYATAMVLDGVAIGLVAEAREGRPIKIEGNPEHPASLGATGVKEQASLLALYDPKRGQTLRQGNVPRSWRGFRQTFAPGAGGGADERVAFLLEPTSSPLMVEMIEELGRRNPKARFFYHGPLMGHGSVEATKALFGRPLAPQLDLEAADVVVALDSDLLAAGPFSVRNAKHFARRRDPGKGDMNRLYVAEPSWTPTGTMADHRLAVAGSRIRDLARALAAEVAGDRLGPVGARAKGWREGAPDPKWVGAVANDLRAHRGRAVVVAGDRQPAEVHALVHLMNEALGNVGRTVSYTDHPVHDVGTERFDLEPLTRALDAGEVDTLVILGGNPVFTAPEHRFAERIRKAKRQVYLGEYENETAEACEWYVPAVHYLEAWGDARAWDGTLTTVQPLIQPLHGGRTETELLAVFLGAADVGARQLLLRSWQRRGLGVDFETTLQRGFVPDSAFERTTPDADAAGLTRLLQDGPSLAADALELDLAGDPKLHDGRFANNAWLLELPEAVTTLTWENAARVSPLTAERLRVETGRLLEVQAGEAKIRIPAQVVPGQADGVISVFLGWGREAVQEDLAKNQGVNAFPLRTREQPWFVPGVKAVRREPMRTLAFTQDHWSMEGRPIANVMTQEEFKAHPEVLHALQERQPTLRQEWPAEGTQWGMAIDLNLCTGCNACVVACQAENNVPVVGKTNVRKGREMYWLRIDRYFTGSPEKPNMVMQPMMCQHCERAPCEYVCPVNATTHSPDGINEMTYNRCVGTRFCSNNCPYKVRRFNWFDFHQQETDLEQMVHNPDVTVRDRGVMEKCTYCVQRIRRAQNRSRIPGEDFDPGEIKTACQQACPTDAILFGPVSDPASAVSRKHEDKRTYKVLNEYGTEPRTRYQARVTNPNPELQES